MLGTGVHKWAKIQSLGCKELTNEGDSLQTSMCKLYTYIHTYMINWRLSQREDTKTKENQEKLSSLISKKTRRQM